LILDEPTTGISAAQRQQLFQTLRQLATQDGLTIALVTHKLADVEALCDEGFILRRGRMVGQFDRKVSKGALVDMMFGTQAQTALAEPPPHHEASGPPLLKVSQLRLSTPLQSIAGIDLEVRPGEVIGLAGLEGSGQIPFMHHCAGLENTSWGGHLLSLGVFMGLGLLFAYLLGYSSTLFVTSLAVLAAVLLSPLALALLRSLGQSEGGIFFQGRPLAWQSYRDLRRQGLAYLSSGRLEEGLISGLSLTEHTALAEGGNPLWVNWRAGRAKTEAAIRTYDIRGQAHSPIQTLSGGNQQRVALSLLPPYLKLAFLENPTRGLDVQSAAHIWNLLLAGRDEGMAIVFSSPDLDEIVKYSDRVLVFASGACTLVEGRLDPQYLGWLIGGSQGEMQHD
jgi:simple sugar transport system ATP-binding protein